MSKNNLIFTPSGIRGIFGEDLTLKIAKRIAIGFGKWLQHKEVIIGRDTRPSGKILERAIIEGLHYVGCKVYNLNVCPTPAIIHAKNRMGIPGGIIISGSHNPPEWNALKILSMETFVSKEEIEEIRDFIENIEDAEIESANTIKSELIEEIEVISDYIRDLCETLDFKELKKENHIKAIIDTGAGAGKLVTPKVLSMIGCDVVSINEKLDENGDFPREIEPIEPNLKDLVVKVWEEKADIGFAHDCDADRLAIIGDDFQCYPEDVGLALITDYTLKKSKRHGKKVIFVTNVASSLRFDALAEKYGADLVRTPIGERYLAEQMNCLLRENKSDTAFGGEGSCGGVMFPNFNNARDGIFAAAKIVEILVKTGKKLSVLVKDLPHFYSKREKIEINNFDVAKIIKAVKRELENEGEEVNQIGLDLRFGKDKEWFVLIHPSNTEPIIRIISEAKREPFARLYCETAAELVRMVIRNQK